MEGSTGVIEGAWFEAMDWGLCNRYILLDNVLQRQSGRISTAANSPWEHTTYSVQDIHSLLI